MPGSPPMSRAEADRVIGELDSAYDRISAAMYALDSQPELAVLRGGTFTGDTARVAADLLTRLDALWSQFAALSDALHRIREVRARRSRPGDPELRVLTLLLRAPVVHLDAGGQVRGDAALGPPAYRLRLTDLARRLETEAGQVAGTLSELGAARSRLTEWFGRVDDAVRRLRSEADVLGGDGPLVEEVDGLGRWVEQACGDALDDPLAATRNGPGAVVVRDRLRELTVEVDALATRLAGFAELRDNYPARVTRLAAELDELATAVTETGRVYAVVLVKIANPALPELPDAGPALRAQLAQLDQLRREHRWPRLDAELVTVERATTANRHRLAELHEAADGLLRRRAELRGRLDAYRAKAGRLGLVEEVELSARYRLARDLLYTRPCDLSAATRAVVAYQRQLTNLAERATPGRREPYP